MTLPPEPAADDPRAGGWMPHSAEELAAIVRASSDAIFTMTMDGTILTWNRGAERIYGHAARTVLGRPFPELFPDEQDKGSPQLLAEIAAGRSVENIEVQRRRADGTLIDLVVTMSPIRNAAGEVDRIAAVAGDITAVKEIQRELAASLERLRETAYRDPLTGIGSRALLIERLEAVGSDGTDITVLTIDIDEFQYFNNTFGHSVGDRALQVMADVLVALSRENEIVARIGGDEFGVLSIGQGPDRGRELAERVLAHFAGPVPVGDHLLALTVGIGVATASCLRPGSADFLMRRADLALHEAKNAGHASWRSYDAAMEASFAARTRMEQQLRAAAGTDQLSLVYQPICDARTGMVREVEALLRWWHPEWQAVPPSEFIPVAEHCGLIVELGRWVLDHACAAIANLPGEEVRLNVNVSPRQLAEPGFPGIVAAALRKSGLRPDRLTVEVTESAIAESASAVSEELAALRDLGVGLAVDDFGTGHSSLARLHALPFTTLKVDKSLVDEIGGPRGSDVIVDAVVGMAHGLGLTVVAEGVERQEQLQRLRDLDCDLIQGFLLHRPMTIGDLRPVLSEQARA